MFSSIVLQLALEDKVADSDADKKVVKLWEVCEKAVYDGLDAS